MLKTPFFRVLPIALNGLSFDTRLQAGIFILFLTIHSAISAFFPAQTSANDLTPANIITAVNREREIRNLLTLSDNSKLAGAAEYKAADMVARRYFSHTDPEGHYIWDKITALGYSPYLQLGENLAIEFYDTDSLVQAWMQSPTHRANILNDGFKDQGMGLALGNANQGQYHSAIANTFGTLLVKKSSPPAATPPAALLKPARKKTLKKSPAPLAKNAPAPAAAPKAYVPVAIRGVETGASYALPQTVARTASSVPATTTPLAPAVVFRTENNTVTAAALNRYVTLAFGLLLAIILINDIFLLVKRGAEHLDKKINNLVLLILSLIAAALMYWL